MQKYFFIISAIFIVGMAQAQNNFKAVVKDEQTKEPILGVTAVVNNTSINSVSNDEGILFISDIPNGEYTITFSSEGYKSKTETFVFPLSTNDTLELFLESESEELKEIMITSTRSSRTIRNIPTRVEFIAGEELEEKGNMKPGDICSPY